jgi:hypothetical protein
VDAQRKLDHVMRELESYSGRKKKVNASSTFIACPFHSENTPSFRIFHSSSSNSPGFGKCYGCGHQVNWNELAPVIGLKPYTWTKPKTQFARALPSREEEAVQRKLKFRHRPIPPGKIWREIKTDTLIDIGATRVTVPGSTLPSMLYFPVMVKGKQRGFIRARMRKSKDGEPSYLNKGGPWSKDFGLFLYDQAVELMQKLGYDTIVLVEGPRDGLRLHELGIPAISILGTMSWSARKSRIVEMTGARRVILAFDGDDAGKKAYDLIHPQLEGLIETVKFDLCGKDSPYWPFRNEDEPTKTAKAAGVSMWDPGNMPIKKVRQLKRLVKGQA